MNVVQVLELGVYVWSAVKVMSGQNTGHLVTK